MGKTSASTPPVASICYTTNLNNLVARIQINEVTCLAILDTGATQTILHPRVVEKMVTRPAMETSYAVIQTVTGDTAPVEGIVEVRMQIGLFSSQHSMYVAPIFDDCIIGMDFLRRHSCEINLKHNTLQVGEETIYLNQANTQHVFATNSCDVHIPALSDCWIRMMTPTSDEEIVLATAVLTKQNMDIPHSVYHVLQGAICICVTNLSEEDIWVPRNTTLVQIESQPEVFNCRRITDDTATPDLSPAIQEMMKRSATSLTPEEQTRLDFLVFRNRSIFADPNLNKGRTSRIQHHINTGDTTPIKQPPRKLPLARRAEAESMLDDMKA